MMKHEVQKHPYGMPLRRRRDYGEAGCGLGLASELLTVAKELLDEDFGIVSSKTSEVRDGCIPEKSIG